MCFDTKSSLIAWSVSVASAVYLYKRNRKYDRWNSMFITSFSTIQALEAGIWHYQPGSTDPKAKKANEILTELILLALMSQPLAQSYMGWLETKELVLKILSWVFIGIILYSFLRIIRAKPGEFSTTIGSKGHLVWKDQKSGSFSGPMIVGLLYLLGLFVPLLYMTGRGAYGISTGLILLAVGIVTAIYAWFYAGPGEFSSYWCYAAVLYSLLAIALP